MSESLRFCTWRDVLIRLEPMVVRDRMYTTAELMPMMTDACRHNVSRDVIYAWMASGDLPYKEAKRPLTKRNRTGRPGMLRLVLGLDLLRFVRERVLYGPKYMHQKTDSNTTA
jgi:hypothetical protein